MCSGLRPSIPSYATSSTSTRDPNATVARIAIFAAASAPLTSSVGIGLGVAEPLRLGERVRVGVPRLHPREDEVGRPVDDPEHAVDVGRDERLPQHLDHRDRRADGGFEAQLNACLRRGGEELGAAAGEQLLVRADDRLARAEEVEHVAAGRLEATHHLGHERDRVVFEDLGEVRGEDAVRRVEAAVLAGVADERLHDPQPVAGRALDVVAALDEHAVDRGADGAVAEERDGNVDGGHCADPIGGAPAKKAPSGLEPLYEALQASA